MIEYGIRSFSPDAPANRFVSVSMPSKKLAGKQILTV